MNWFARIERSIAEFVERSFARTFPSDLEPAQIARKLVAVMEAQTRSSVDGGNRAPSAYEARVSELDYERLAEHRDYLERQWADLLEDCAARVGIAFSDGPARVRMIARPDLPAGTVDVRVEPEPTVDEALDDDLHHRFFLHMVQGAPAYGIFALEESTVIGRSESSDIFLLDPGISRIHARIDISDGEATIVDCESTNGTYINDVRIERHVLEDGDEIVVGSTRMRVEIRD
uniref:Putative FHA domain protein n=1 Tax=mine drainage metagenome TaxID=410659 RepID=E6PFK5_9ZZZZ